MTINVPTESFTPTNRATNDELRDICERQVAAKICGMLPPGDASARRILAHAGTMFEQFTSIAAVRASEAAR
jgi:hypothetical protein